MTAETETLIRQVVDRGFEIRIEGFSGHISVTITDENDPRLGCAQLRGESAAGKQFQLTVEAALVEACTQAVNDVYPQATTCGRCVAQVGIRGEWTTCVLAKVHDDGCIDQYGNREVT